MGEGQGPHLRELMVLCLQNAAKCADAFEFLSWRRAVLPSLPWVVCFLSFFQHHQLAQVGTLSFSHPLFGVSVLFILFSDAAFVAFDFFLGNRHSARTMRLYSREGSRQPKRRFFSGWRPDGGPCTLSSHQSLGWFKVCSGPVYHGLSTPDDRCVGRHGTPSTRTHRPASAGAAGGHHKAPGWGNSLHRRKRHAFVPCQAPLPQHSCRAAHQGGVVAQPRYGCLVRPSHPA